VKVNGAEHKGFDANAQTITLTGGLPNKVEILAEY